MSDIRDILELEPLTPEISKEVIMGTTNKKAKPKKPAEVMKRPEGMHRELFALLYTDNKDAAPLLPTDTGKGYKRMKAKLGMKRVRPWKWVPFTNPSRKDGFVLHHWRRVTDEGKPYPFARFNKSVDIAEYTNGEYEQHLQLDGWTRAETDHLFQLARQFDLRFIVMQDRWNKSQFPKRSVEDLKERYYGIVNTLIKVRATEGQQVKTYEYDAEHERRRKEQLKKLFNRTPEQVEEEQMLLTELRRIEARKKERERKTQDLQKLITAADTSTDTRRHEKKGMKKKLQPQTRVRSDSSGQSLDTAGIKFPDTKTSGVSLRSQRMKLPANVGQKKTKAIEQLLQELGIELNPMPTEDICTNFNELRSDLVLLYELKVALSGCEFELQTLRHQYEAMAPGRTLDIPPSLLLSSSSAESFRIGDDRNKTKSISEMIDLAASPGTPSRKRKAALEQSNVLKKLKARS